MRKLLFIILFFVSAISFAQTGFTNLDTVQSKSLLVDSVLWLKYVPPISTGKLLVESSGKVGYVLKENLSFTSNQITDFHATVNTNTKVTDAYNGRISSFTANGNSGQATFSGNVLNVPNYTLSGLGGQSQLNGTGYVKMTGTTVSYDNTVAKIVNYNTNSIPFLSTNYSLSPTSLTYLNDQEYPEVYNDGSFSARRYYAVHGATTAFFGSSGGVGALISDNIFWDDDAWMYYQYNPSVASSGIQTSRNIPFRVFTTPANSTTQTTLLRTYSNGNFKIGSNATDTGFKLKVEGTGSFDGTVKGANATLSSEFVTLGQLPTLTNIVTNTITSTDNSIARFDGTTGKVIQNSTVTISDEGHIHSSSVREISGFYGSQSPWNTLGKLYTGLKFDRLQGANTRYTITTTNITSPNLAFDQSYDSNASATNIGSNMVWEIDYAPNKPWTTNGTNGYTYANGTLIIQFYNTDIANNITVELLNRNNTTGLDEWSTISTVTGNTKRVVMIPMGGLIYNKKLRITIGGAITSYIRVSSIEYFTDRQDAGEDLAVLPRFTGTTFNTTTYPIYRNTAFEEKVRIDATATNAIVAATPIQSTGFYNGTTNDLNNLASSTGVFKFEQFPGSAANKPTTHLDNANGVLTFNTSGTNYAKQIAWVDNDDLWTRKIVAGTPGTWHKLFHSGNSNLSTVDWAANNLTVSSSANINGTIIGKGTQALTETAGAVTWNYLNGSSASVTIDEPTVITLSNVPDGAKGNIYIVQGDSGNDNVTFAHSGLTVKWRGNDKDLTDAAGSYDVVSFWRAGSILFVTLGSDYINQ